MSTWPSCHKPLGRRVSHDPDQIPTLPSVRSGNSDTRTAEQWMRKSGPRFDVNANCLVYFNAMEPYVRGIAR